MNLRRHTDLRAAPPQWLLICLLAWGPMSCGTEHDDQGTQQPPPGATEENPGGGDPLSGELKCADECAAGQYTECTCAADDPCGWQDDDYCDNECSRIIPTGTFDESTDCCEEQCAAGLYTTCTCRLEDPCNWRDNGRCEAECQYVLPGAHFDDRADCGGFLEEEEPENEEPVDNDLSGPCKGACAAREYNECTCSPRDPCGWLQDGICHDCVGRAPHVLDDRDDCTPIELGERTYAVTAVRDNLNINDYEIMTTGLADLGYRQVRRSRHVSSPELVRYLQDPRIHTLYHTGHGTRGQVATATSHVALLEVNVAARNVIFATCLTLAPERSLWQSVMTVNSHTILGYTKESLDYTDDQVAESFLEHLAEGHPYMRAWILSHLGINALINRWAGYVRERGAVVEYSARSGTHLVSTSRALFVELGTGSGVFLSDELLRQDRPLHQSFRSATLRPHNGSPFAPPDISLSRSGRATMSSSEARHRGTAWLVARDEMPVDALFDRVVTIQRRDHNDDTPHAIGYIVRYIRHIEGIPLRSNVEEPHLTLYVDNHGVTALSRVWPQIVATDGQAPELLSPSDAAMMAAPHIGAALKGDEVRLLRAQVVYGTSRDSADLTPAYLIETAQAQGIVVDAASGEPL